MAASAMVMAGIPEINAALYHRIRFSVGDPVAYVWFPDGAEPGGSVLILRDIEMERARRHARADVVNCPADYAPAAGLSGDRETATAQAAAECLRRRGVTCVTADRSLPLIFADVIRQAGIAVECDAQLGVLERRQKDPQEIAWLRQAQKITQQAVEMACRRIASAHADREGFLLDDAGPLTCESVRATIDHWLLDRGFSNPPAIVAGGPAAADCHDIGSGPLRTQQPVIIDVFPRDRATHYYGDCTRTVVHGPISAAIEQMHRAVVQAKAAGIAAIRAGVTGEAVHDATARAITNAGFAMGLPPAGARDDHCAMTHGTGHGVGLEVHEPPLLDKRGPVLLAGDVVTVEPGLYCRSVGAVRVEDMVAVTPDGCENLNGLYEGLDWT